MSKTSYFLIFILLLCISLYGFVQYSPSIESRLPKLTESVEEQDTLAKGTLSLAPTVQNLLPGQTGAVELFITTENSTPAIIQFEIAYDPITVTPLQITPGKYFNNPIVVLNSVNPRNGRISYALKCSADFKKDPNASCGNNQVDSVARITFNVNPGAGRTETTFDILPKTLLETKEKSKVILQTENAKVNINGAIIAPASSSAVLAE